MSRILMEYIKGLFMPVESNGYRPRILEGRYFLIVLVFLFGIKVLSLVSFEQFLKADIFNQIEKSDLYMLTNQTREDSNVPELIPNSKLENAAQMKLEDIFQNNYFAHNSPSGITPWYWMEMANYQYNLAGENLAMNFFSSDQAMKAWLNSESHKHNILLKDFTEIGIAVGSGMVNNQKTIVVVQMFGKPRMPIIKTVQAQAPVKIQATKVPTPKPSVKSKVTPKPTKAAVVKPTFTPRISVSASPLPKSSVTPNFISNTSPSPSIKVTPGVRPRLQSQVKGLSAYSYNIFLSNIMVALSMILMAVLFLKIFVKVNIQFPDLIFRALLLLVVSIAFTYVEDSQLLTMLNGSIIIPN